MDDIAGRTRPLAHIQRQSLIDVPARMTALAAGIPAVNLGERAPVPIGFVFQLADELTPADIADRFGK
jgi:hypothetical protein